MVIEPVYPPPVQVPAQMRSPLWAAAFGFGCVAGCGLLALLTAVACGVFFWQASIQPENITVSVDAPTVVNAGETFVITVVIDNTGALPRELNSIDIEMLYLDGVNIESTQPSFVQSERIDLLEGFAFQSYYFYEPMLANSTLVVKMEALALKTGDFGGYLDVCVDTIDDCTRSALRTIVE
jgi:hypothetical protein